MAKSNTASNTIQLPGGCYISEMKISPADLSMEKDWFIYYTFYDPEYLKGKRRQIRGMNDAKTFKKRMFATKKAMESEMQLLLSGVNPIRSIQNIVADGEVLPTTDLATALWTAFEKVSGVEGTLKDIKATITGTLNAARKLGFDRMPVMNVSRKYFKLIFEQCRKDNPRFTNNRQNVYRKWLKKLYDELIEMEAVETNPLIFIRKEKIVKKDRAIPTYNERAEINKLRETNYYFWRAINVFFSSGSRETEFMSVKKKHVDMKQQRCLYTIKKRGQPEEVWRPITKAALPLWQEIINECKSDEDYLFSYDLKPGAHKLTTEALSKRWKRHIKKGMGINVDFYSLKYANTTELMDKLDKLYNPAKDVAKLTGHKQEAMIVKIYDKNNKERKDDKIREAGGLL